MAHAGQECEEDVITNYYKYPAELSMAYRVACVPRSRGSGIETQGGASFTVNLYFPPPQ